MLLLEDRSNFDVSMLCRVHAGLSPSFVFPNSKIQRNSVWVPWTFVQVNQRIGFLFRMTLYFPSFLIQTRLYTSCTSGTSLDRTMTLITAVAGCISLSVTGYLIMFCKSGCDGTIQTMIPPSRSVMNGMHGLPGGQVCGILKI